MQQFDNSSKPNRSGAVSAGVAIAENQQSRPEALAAATKKVGGNFGDGLESRGALPRKLLFDEDEIVAD
jgi:hypothetical protein